VSTLLHLLRGLRREYLVAVRPAHHERLYACGIPDYWTRYLKPRVGKYALRDFTVAVVSRLLEDIANMHKLNTDTVGKIRSILSGIFKYAMGKGDFPGKSAADNPARSFLSLLPSRRRPSLPVVRKCKRPLRR
jgi:hypothetical protein